MTGVSQNYSEYSIAILSCYMGTLPVSYRLWEKSCKYNPSYSFFLVTDQLIQTSCPNLIVYNLTLSELSSRICEKLGIKSEILRPYKICDFKPMYGVIFSDLLGRYDFWGHCDLDQIFGDLSKFIGPDVLRQYSKIYELGHLTLYRNNNCMNYLFTKDGGMNWMEAALSNDSCFFDEVIIREKCRCNGISVYTSRDYADIDPWHKRFRLSNDRLSIKDILKNNKTHQIFYWEDGKVFRVYKNKKNKYGRDEFCYIHFQKRNLSAPEFNIDCANAFYITYQGFFLKEKVEPDISGVNQYNRYPGLWIEIIEYLRFLYIEYKKRLTKRFNKNRTTTM